MRMRRKIKIYTKLSFLLVTFTLNIDFAHGKNGKWKPGNEDHRRFPIKRTLQNDGLKIITAETIQNDGLKITNTKTIQNDRRISNDRILQNSRIPTAKTILNDRRLQVDGDVQNDKRIPTGKVIHNERMHIDGKINNDRIMREEGRKRIQDILKKDQLTNDDIQKKIDSLTQNKNILNYNRVQNGRRMLNLRKQNYIKTQNDLKVQNPRRVLDKRNQELINARRTGYERIMWAATTHRARLTEGQFDWTLNPYNIAQEGQTGKSKPALRTIPDFNSTELQQALEPKPKEEPDERRWPNFFNYITTTMGTLHARGPAKHTWMITRACHIIATTHISAEVDHKKYFTVRYFYQNNLAYEVGYLVNEIVLKYQRMLELYDLATKYFFKNQKQFYAPSTYVFYIYTNVLEMGTVITHLCNMLQEIEAKYRFIPVNQSAFSDYHLLKKPRSFNVTDRDGAAAQIAAYERHLALMRKQRKKSRKKKAKYLDLQVVPSTPKRRPKNSRFPLEYGWSIENIW